MGVTSRGFKHESALSSKYLFFWADFFNPWPTSLPVDAMPRSKTSRESNCCIQVLFTALHGPFRYNGGRPPSAGSACWAVPELPEAGRSQHQPSCGDLWHPLWQTGKTPEQSGTVELPLNHSVTGSWNMFEWHVGKCFDCSFCTRGKLKGLTSITRFVNGVNSFFFFHWLHPCFFSCHQKSSIFSVFPQRSNREASGLVIKTETVTWLCFFPSRPEMLSRLRTSLYRNRAVGLTIVTRKTRKNSSSYRTSTISSLWVGYM